MTNSFIADVHLGKLARLLRLLGFDTLYRNDYSKLQLIDISKQEDRVLLSRDSSLQKNIGVNFFIVNNEDPARQLVQVVNHFNLKDRIHPFSRCLLCNGILQATPKEMVADKLEKNTRQYFSEFWQCNQCKHIYWKGSHYERMLKTIENVLS